MKINLLRFIAWYEMIWGALGFVFTLPVTLLTLASLNLRFLIDVLGLALFGLSFYAGMQILKGTSEGVKLSMWAQAFQIPAFSIAGSFSYWFLAGIELLELQFSLTSSMVEGVFFLVSLIFLEVYSM
jgi:hypothetical protein